jgi:hypothetical protein
MNNQEGKLKNLNNI